jgi:hypothetical protein
LRVLSIWASIIGAAMLVCGPGALAQDTACYTYDPTGRLVEAEYSDGSEIQYDLDRNDNRNGTDQSPSGAATCPTPVVNIGPIPGGDLDAGVGAPPPGGGGGGGGGTVTAAFDDGSGVMTFGSVTISALLNDTVAAGGTLTITSVSTPSAGSAVITMAGTKIQYSAGSSPGIVLFTYTISDGIGGTDTATVEVEVFTDF